MPDKTPAPAGQVIPLNKGYELAVTEPEEAAGAAYQAMQPLLDSLGILTHSLPMDMAERVLTNSEAVSEATSWVKAHPDATYVKGPGITPKDEQVISTIIQLEERGRLHFTGTDGDRLNHEAQDLREEHLPLPEFATRLKAKLKPIGSPNAVWRDELAATLHRGVTDALMEHSTTVPPKWSDNQPLTVYAFAATPENRQTNHLYRKQTISVTFTPATGAETVTVGKALLSQGTPVRLFTAHQEAFREQMRKIIEAIAAGTDIAYGLKQTVLKTFDGAQLAWLQDILNEGKCKGRIAGYAAEKSRPGTFNNGLLVDNLFSILSTERLTSPTAIICSDHSYSEYVRVVWEEVGKRGGFKIPFNSEIVRASATGDHYKAMQYKAPGDGVIEVKAQDGTVLMSKKLTKGDVAMVTHFDHSRVREMITQTLDAARACGRTNILFGFDEKDEYYRTAVAAMHDIARNFGGLKIRVMSAAIATAEYFTSGGKDMTLVLNNIYGDFATDIELCGKGTSYSTAIIPDEKGGVRGVVELGSGGTAPTLLKEWKESGMLRFNPISFLEGIVLALRFAAQNMEKNKEDSRRTHDIANALEQGIYATTNQGIVVPIAKDKFKRVPARKPYTLVGAHTFLKSGQLEAFRILKDKYPEFAKRVPELEADLKRMLVMDKALVIVDEKHGENWKAANTGRCDTLEKEGLIDFFYPDYTMPMPEGKDALESTPEELAERLWRMVNTPGRKTAARA